MEKQTLTTRQREILEYLETFTRTAGYPPTVREICKATGLRSPRSASQHLQALEDKGYIARGRDKSRAIRFLHKTIVPDGPLPGNVVNLPLRGTVAAGHPVTAGETSPASLMIDRELVPGDGAFIMRVEGQSMSDAHVIEGDYVVVDPAHKAGSGDIVVARIGRETTVKRLMARGGSMVLAPENDGSTMDPIDIRGGTADVAILGKVVGVIRRMT